jgi:hypothetical protein
VHVSDLGNEGLRIRIGSNRITIVGGKLRGTLYGVYEFAEKYLGIRFLTHNYTYIPTSRKQILIPIGQFSYVPVFIYRNCYYKENMLHPEFSVRLRLNSFATGEKYGGVCDMEFVNHSFGYQIPVDSYGVKHPEYFAEINGKRSLEGYGGGPQLCVTNPDVIKLLTKAVFKKLQEHPGIRNVGVVQNDNNNYCKCVNCEAINQKEKSPMGAQMIMINAVAKEIGKMNKEAIVGTLAYQYTRKRPLTIVPDANVMVQLCSIECDMLHPYADKDNEMNRAFAHDLAEWGQVCENLWIWDYMVDFNCYGLPFPNLQSIGKNISYYRDNHIKGVFMEGNYSSEAGELSDLKNYVASQCLWKPGSDSWELTKEFCNLYYRKSAKPILEYLTVIHDKVKKKNLKARCNPVKPHEIGLDSIFSKYIFAKFEEALLLADDTILKERVERASLCAYVSVLETSLERNKKIAGEFVELARKYNMTYYDEGTLTENKKFE